ncbi:MAG TPA: glycosyltransferase family 4 protein [Solirubrobacteraceae bacterium]|nr:glycosyltransferase family 4 protein [Solirubrobacteraceae bacterium]
MSSVALLSPCYWPEVRRGGERFVRELADGLIGAGVAPTLITSHPGRPSRRVEDGLRVLRLPRPPEGPLLRRGCERYLTHVPLSEIALRVGHFGLAHATYPADALAAARWRAATGRPALLTYLGIPDAVGLDARRGHRRLMEQAVARLDRVVALSVHAARAFADELGYAAPVIAPGIDTDAFSPGGERAAHPVILCAADAREPRKHVPLLVAALERVRGELPDAELWLSAPRSLPVTPGVRWLNLDDRGVLAAALRRAWLAALPSESEAFGLVLAEALACGTPVVGYADAAIPEIIDSPTVGRLFDTLTPGALAEALLAGLELSGRPETAGACRRRALELSSARMTAAYLELYRELGLEL